MAYWGLDVSAYPGDSKMQDWWSNSPCYFTGFYLAPAPHHPDTGWMTKRSTLLNQGWGFLPIYVGRQTEYGDSLTSSNGTLDAQNAVSLAQKASFPAGSYIYLDIELGGDVTAYMNYIKAWIQEVMYLGYGPGIYCSYNSAAQINTIMQNPNLVRFWVWHFTGAYNSSNVLTGTALDPSSSGISYAGAWQLAQNISKTEGSSTINPVDIDVSSMTDPSRPLQE